LGDPIVRHYVDSADAAAVRSLAAQIAKDIPVVTREDQLRRIALMCHQLPLSLREALVNFRLADPAGPKGGFVISGLSVDDVELGATPTHSADIPRGPEISRADALILLLASLLGDPFSLAGVHEGRLINDIFPMKGDEDTQLASSSLGGLEWHNEDAYSDIRADWLLLICLRNPAPSVATTFGRLHDVYDDLAGDVREALFTRQFSMLPDSSHTADTGETEPRPISVLDGTPSAPIVRIDPAFMSRDLSSSASAALDAAIAGFERNLQDVVLLPGEILVIDNYRAVHGRRPFEPRYDGTDRWLRAVNVTANLRRFVGERGQPHGRALKVVDDVVAVPC
jgi:Fe(II)/alpha-ketoglutarate-dependent arginine beta-hydroxylase